MQKITQFFNAKLGTSMCLFIFLFINTLFCVKYFARYTDFYVIATLFVDFILVFFFYTNFRVFNKKSLAIINYLLLVIYVIFCVIIFQVVDVDSLQVDRWSIITSFWENFEKGKYVYYAKSNVGNYPGPMPFYYILAYPFYALKELGYFSMLCIPLFFLLLSYIKSAVEIKSKVLLLLLVSPFLWWEIMCRSNILLNSVLVLFSLVYFFNSFPNFSIKKMIVSGILFGLLLSIRNVFAIAYIVACVYALKSRYVSFYQMLILGCISLLTFACTFVPFIYGHWKDFLVVNPFIIQGSALMPFAYTLIFILLAFVFGLRCKSPKDVYFYITLDLFLCILTYLIYHIVNIGFESSFINSIVDISYFLFCIPFALFFVVKNPIHVQQTSQE